MIELTVDQSSLKRIVYALEAEENGAALRRDLAKNLRQAVGPAADASRQSLLSMESSGHHEGVSLRSFVAAQVKTKSTLSGDSAGVRVTAGRAGPRGFTNAARRLNSAAGWRHKSWGHDPWHQQIGKPGWFDDPIRARYGEFRDAVLDAMQETARRIAAEVGNG